MVDITHKHNIGHDIPSVTYVNNHAHICFDFSRDNGTVSGLDDNDSDIETEAEWFDKPQVGNVNPSKMLDVMAIEVCSS